MITRGDVVWVHLEPRSGSEQRGTRPAVVISSDVFNHNPRWNSLVAVPCTTSRLQGARPATVVELPKRLTGLREDGFAICHQLTTLDTKNGVRHHKISSVGRRLEVPTSRIRLLNPNNCAPSQ